MENNTFDMTCEKSDDGIHVAKLYSDTFKNFGSSGHSTSTDISCKKCGKSMEFGDVVRCELKRMKKDTKNNDI